jgi:lipoprotein-releasing system permease protein
VPFEWIVAIRYLREGRTQTALIFAGVGVGVAVIIFLSSLITGLQESIVRRTLGTQAHVVIRPPEERPRPTLSAADSTADPRIERPPQRIRSIVGWQQVVDGVRRFPDVTAVAPTVNGPAFALRGNGSFSVAVRGLDPVAYAPIVDLAAYVTQGSLDLAGFEAAIGTELAENLGVVVGDKIRLQNTAGATTVFIVRSIFDIGNRDLNQRWVIVPLRSAQSLLGLEGGVSTIEVKVREIFAAEEAAIRIAERTGLVADSWMGTNAQLLVGLRSQGSSSIMIQVFVVLAVALGIASVLAVSVVQKSREIGILKAMGVATGRVVRIFLLQGAIVGLAGSAVGVLVGIGLSLFFASLATNPDGTPTFPVNLNALLYARSALIATSVGIVAAVLPARRAARLDPAQVIRGG